MKQVVEEHPSAADYVSPGGTRENRPEMENRPPVENRPQMENRPQTAPGTNRDEALAPLLPSDYVSELRSRWQNIQTGFVDDPKTAVQQADQLVDQAIQRLTQSFADSRKQLEGQWGSAGDVENLRIAFRKYRSFFEHLLSV